MKALESARAILRAAVTPEDIRQAERILARVKERLGREAAKETVRKKLESGWENVT